MSIQSSARRFDVEAILLLSGVAHDLDKATDSFSTELEKISGALDVVRRVGRGLAGATPPPPPPQFAGNGVQTLLPRSVPPPMLDRAAGAVGQGVSKAVGTVRQGAALAGQAVQGLPRAAGAAVGTAEAIPGRAAGAAGRVVGKTQQGLQNMGTEFRAGRAGIPSNQQRARDAVQVPPAPQSAPPQPQAAPAPAQVQAPPPQQPGFFDGALGGQGQKGGMTPQWFAQLSPRERQAVMVGAAGLGGAGAALVGNSLVN